MSDKLKEIVKEKYGQIARESEKFEDASCCGDIACCGDVSQVFAMDYKDLKGYNRDADLSLGCGLPTEFAIIKEGDTVLDLGSGAGNDCFVARELVGEKGKVIGVDITEEMIIKSRQNTDKLGYNNVEFRMGDIENLPIGMNTIDVVVSNCVLNLVPDKNKAFNEAFLVLKAGGHFSVSDIVLEGDIPEALKEQAELYAGCVSGAIQKEAYLGIIKSNGFEDIQVQKERKIEIPTSTLKGFLSDDQLMQYQNADFGIYSITVYARKPNK